ncbi:LysR family transcriptional regulator [Bordetella sp. BOR01]|uniref:LysR family transcriptional regulator n=1 Tax=Bordetella sp. BOR01 TaxID=2854779 RepID=UPI001C447C84|nr:LysR family transcriptional regulator [Bordetella sp. BOR01]MBV7485824.1 LysR family transcriptional regulator [Bordetella sp. BOR01]
MTPTLRQLQAFAHVYRLGSLTQAAQAMHVTQSAASVLLQQLEEALGVRLFDRTSRTLRPTDAAHEAYAMAQRVLRDVDQLVGNARGLADRRRGLLHFAVTTSVAATLMPVVIEQFQQRYPDIRLVMHDMSPDRLIAPVLEQDVEFSIGTPDARAPGITLTPLLRDQLGVVCRDDSPLAIRKRLRWRDLREFPLITVRHGNGIRTLIDSAMSQTGIDFHPAWEVSFLSTALALTARGLGVSVLPGYLVSGFQYPNLLTRPLHEPAVERSLYLVTRKAHALSPAATALIGIFNEMLAQPR